MFSFGKKDTFVDASPKIRRLVDLTTPNRPVVDNIRQSQRYNRCIPVAIADWDDREGPLVEHVGLGFTTDLSDNGFGVLTQFKPKTPNNVIAFYLQNDMDIPWYFQSVLTTYRKQPGGFHKLGYSVVSFLNDRTGSCSSMNSIAIELLTVEV